MGKHVYKHTRQKMFWWQRKRRYEYVIYDIRKKIIVVEYSIKVFLIETKLKINKIKEKINGR